MAEDPQGRTASSRRRPPLYSAPPGFPERGVNGRMSPTCFENARAPAQRLSPGGTPFHETTR